MANADLQKRREYNRAYMRRWSKTAKGRATRAAWVTVNREKQQAYMASYCRTDKYREAMRLIDIRRRPGIKALSKAISESLVALFEVLPTEWHKQLALEILDSSSCQDLCWTNPDLEDYIVEYTEEVQ